nr:radical SAM (seleno)protein TrsS [Desulfitobacterium hafniense]
MSFSARNKVGAGEKIIGLTQSVCPVCLKSIPAERIQEQASVYLRKTCKEHGDFKTVIWRGQPDFMTWGKQKKPEKPITCQTATERGCPFDCGLCPNHKQQTCCALIEVTQRCNLRCSVCFADAGSNCLERQEEVIVEDPTKEELLSQLETLWNTIGKCNLQFSGGEPTLRNDLPGIIRAARLMGYTFFQLNTNGIRLAEDPGFVRDLKEAGLSTVFLQFDGVSDDVYERLRGQKLLAQKQKAIENCRIHKLGIVLVPTLVPGVNTDQIGDIVRFALERMPVVRGVHFQPISYFGRYPVPPEDKDRITLPEVLQSLEKQTNGLLKAANFTSSACESAWCSFHGDFIYMEDGVLTPVTEKKECCDKSDYLLNERSVTKNQNFVVNRWQILSEPGCCTENTTEVQDGFDIVLDRIKNYRISITCMTFQDAYNLDLERLQYCCIPVISGDKAIPFCAFNLTGRDGQSLYRGNS